METIHFLCISALIATAWGCATPGAAEDRRQDKNKLVVGAFNARWMFDCIGNDPAPVEWCQGPPFPDAPTHIKDVGTYLEGVKPDILGMEEVENCQVLTDMLAAMPTTGTGLKRYLVPGTDTATNQNVAIVSKIEPKSLTRAPGQFDYPISGTKCPAGNVTPGKTGVSKNLFAMFNIPPIGDFLVVVLHLIAFPDVPDRCMQREAQARVIADAVKASGAKEYIILGDFNDHSCKVPDNSKDMCFSDAVEWMRTQSGQTAFEGMESLPQAERQTHGLGGAIDHLLISPGLKQYLKAVKILSQNSPSDHRAIYAEFEFPPNGAPTAPTAGAQPTAKTPATPVKPAPPSVAAKSGDNSLMIGLIAGGLCLLLSLCALGAGAYYATQDGNGGIFFRGRKNTTPVDDGTYYGETYADNTQTMGDYTRTYSPTYDSPTMSNASPTYNGMYYDDSTVQVGDTYYDGHRTRY